MKHTRKAVALSVITAGFVLLAFQPLNTLPLQPESRVWVKGTSTVRDYTCTAGTIDATVIAPAAETASLPFGRLVRTAEVAVPVAGLDCGNGTMNEHMRKALKAGEHATLAFVLTSYTIEEPQTIRINGNLTLAGRTVPIEVEGTITEAAGGIVRVEASREIRMTDWGIKPPTLMLGALKVRDPVTIGLDIQVKR